MFDQWKSNYNLPIATPATSDGDGDGLWLLLEYALGLDPTVVSVAGLPTGCVTNGFLTLTYTTIRAAIDITVSAEVAASVAGEWSSAAGDVDQLWNVSEGLTTRTITARDRTGDADSRFMRLKVTQP